MPNHLRPPSRQQPQTRSPPLIVNRQLLLRLTRKDNIVIVLRALLFFGCAAFLACLLFSLYQASRLTIQHGALWLTHDGLRREHGPRFWLLSLIIAFMSTLILGLGACASISNRRLHLLTFVVAISAASLCSFYASLKQANNMDRKGDVTYFKQMMQDYLEDYQFAPAEGDRPNEATTTWDYYQDVLECCGLEGPADWIPVRAKYLSHPRQLLHVLPLTCCWYETDPNLLRQSKNLCPRRHFPSVRGCLAAYIQVTNYRYVILVLGNYVPVSLDLLAALILLLTRHTTPPKTKTTPPSQPNKAAAAAGPTSHPNQSSAKTKRHTGPPDKQHHSQAVASKRK